MPESSVSTPEVREASELTLSPSTMTAPHAPGDSERSMVALATRLAEDEILRPVAQIPDTSEPLSLQWFLELERRRYRRQGRWVPSHLEFPRHQGDRVLCLGTSLGSDWVQYARHGADVTVVTPVANHLALVRRNFELRGLRATFLHADPAHLPLEAASIDVVCFTGLLHERNNPDVAVQEAYRVLKPGGKVLAVVPATYTVEYWARLRFFFRTRKSQSEEVSHTQRQVGLLSPSARRFTSGDLRQLFGRFIEARVCKRHLQRGEVPHFWRWLPLSLLERLMGRLLILKAFKPLSSALSAEQLAA